MMMNSALFWSPSVSSSSSSYAVSSRSSAIQRRKPQPHRNQNTFCSFARRQLIFLILPHSKVFRFAFFQCFKHQIDGILEIFVVLPNLHALIMLTSIAKFRSSSGTTPYK